MSQKITPYLLYRDGGAAIEWLSRAFGFKETVRMADDDGRLAHAEMELAGGEIMLGSPRGEFRTPKELGATTGLVHVYVDDVDAHYARARDAGVTIEQEPTDQDYGDRSYAAIDPEGHHWYFAQRLVRSSESP